MKTLIFENEDIDIWKVLSSFLNFSLYFLVVPRAAGAIRKLSQKIALGWFSDPHLPTHPPPKVCVQPQNCALRTASAHSSKIVFEFQVLNTVFESQHLSDKLCVVLASGSLGFTWTLYLIYFSEPQMMPSLSASSAIRLL